MALKEFKFFYNIQKTHLNFYCIEGIGSKKSAGPGVLRCTCTCTQKMFVGFRGERRAADRLTHHRPTARSTKLAGASCHARMASPVSWIWMDMVAEHHNYLNLYLLKL